MSTKEAYNEMLRAIARQLNDDEDRLDAAVRAAVTYYWTEIDGQQVRVARYPAPDEVKEID